MSNRLGWLAICLLVSLAYWQLISGVLNVDEPWDSPAYWTIAYPLSLVLSAGFGAVAQRNGWLAGIVVTLAQLPVVLLNSGLGPLLPIGVVLTLFLALPAAAASAFSSWCLKKLRAG